MDSTLRSLEFDSAWHVLLNTLIVTHFSIQHSVCVVRGLQDDLRFEFPRATVYLQMNASISSNDFHGQLVEAINAGCADFLLTENTLFPFLDTFRAAHEAAFFRASDKRTIVVTSSKAFDRPRLIKHAEMEITPYIMFLVVDETTRTVELFTTDLFPARPTGITVELVRLDRFFLRGKTFPFANVSDYFPDVFSDMRGRRVRVSTLPYAPYSVVKEVPLGQGNARSITPTNYSLQTDGTELLMFEELCIRYNCSLEIDALPESAWGEVYSNGSADGVIGSIKNRRVDAGVGAIYRWFNWYAAISHSAYTGRGGVSILVPRPRLLPQWQTPFLAFPLTLWLMVSFSFCAGTTAVFITERHRHWIRHRHDSRKRRYRLVDAIFFMVSLYVEQSAPLHHDMVAGTLLLTFLLFGGFMVGNCYAGALSCVMTVPRYEKSIDTRADFLASGMKFVGTTPVWIYTLALSKQPDIVKLCGSYEVYEADTLSRFVHTRNDLGYIHERMQYGSFSLEPFIDLYASHQLQLLREEVFAEIVITACSKTWPMKRIYDDLVLRVHQAGIFRYWEHGSTFRNFGQEIQRNLAYGRVRELSSEPVKMNMSHLLGVFFILFVGQMLGTVTFIAEVLLHRSQRQRPTGAYKDQQLTTQEKR